ncbi:MAG: SGNH/GDSL hydrolase family protein [Phycisphaeraceae bacterium]
MIQTGDIVLFQGDSITDCGRDRANGEPNHSEALGRGYAFHAAAGLLADHPDKRLQIFNRGISGDKVTDLALRWENDTLELRPRVLSVLIGVNDTWHGTGKGNPAAGVPLDEYAGTYHRLLTEAVDTLPGVRLVLGEPFVLPCGAVTEAWLPEMRKRQAVVRQLAAELGAAFVPYQSLFDEACEKAGPAYWAHDGVHPTPAGHELMARAWREAVEA